MIAALVASAEIGIGLLFVEVVRGKQGTTCLRRVALRVDSHIDDVPTSSLVATAAL